MSELLKRTGSAVVLNWPVLFRAALYFWITFLTGVWDKIFSFLEKDEWPTKQRFVLAVLAGTISGLVALRAFYDGSAQRHQDEQQEKTT